MSKLFWILRAVVYKLIFKKIGFPSYLGKPVCLYGARKISIGKKVRIYPLSRMEVHGTQSEIVIKDNVSIAQGFHIISGGQLIIESGVLIAPGVFVNNMDNDYHEIDVPIFDQRQIVKETHIGENCFIGIGACIQAGTTLGKQCIVGAGAVVKGIFPDFCVIVGNPAIIIKRFDIEAKKWGKTNSKGEFLP
ncbi:acyltransferase [Akkermansiaceae bacterium]|nr:acyltransferase [Akkermansiaceae bacterium]